MIVKSHNLIFNPKNQLIFCIFVIITNCIIYNASYAQSRLQSENEELREAEIRILHLSKDLKSENIKLEKFLNQDDNSFYQSSKLNNKYYNETNKIKGLSSILTDRGEESINEDDNIILGKLDVKQYEDFDSILVNKKEPEFENPPSVEQPVPVLKSNPWQYPVPGDSNNLPLIQQNKIVTSLTGETTTLKNLIDESLDEECNQKASDLLDDKGYLIKKGTKEQKLILTTRLEDYDTACLIKDLSKIPLEIRKSTGILIDQSAKKNRGVICSATRISPLRVITSRHCFYDKNYNTRNSLMDKIKNKKIIYTNIEDKSVNQIVIGIQSIEKSIKSAKSIPVSNDYLILKLKNDGQKYPHIPITSSTVKIGTKMYQIGYSSLIAAADGYKKSWRNYIRAVNVNQCIVVDVSDSCFVHWCQTQEGFSGSGMINASNYNLIGVHSRSVLSRGGECSTTKHKYGNTASSIKNTVLVNITNQ